MSEVRALDTNIRYLRYMYLWPNEGENVSGKLYKIKFTICSCITLITSLGAAISIIRQVKGLNNFGLVDILENLVVSIISWTAYYVGAFYMTKVEQIYKLYIHINDFTEFPKPPNFDALNKKLNLFVKCYFYMAYSIIMLYCMYSLYEKNQCLEDNVKYNRDRACGLFTQIWMPFSLKDFPLNQLFLVLQTLTTIFLVSVPVHVFAIIFVVVANIILRFDTLHSFLVEAFNETDITKKRTIFKHCVQWHINIIELANRVNACFSWMLFAIVTIYSVIMAVVAFQLSKVPTIKALGHLCGWLGGLFIISFAGQNITNQCYELNKKLYELPWYIQAPWFQRDFLMVLQRSQKPFEIYAGSFITVSFPTLQAVLRNTYTVVAVLNIVLPDINEF